MCRSKSIVNHDHVYETVLPMSMPNTFPRQAEPQARMYEVPISASLTLTRLGNDTSTSDKSFLEPQNSEEYRGTQHRQNVQALTPNFPQEVVYINWKQRNTDPLSKSHDCPTQFCTINDTHLDMYKDDVDSTEQKEGRNLLETSTDSWVMLAQKIAGHANYTT